MTTRLTLDERQERRHAAFIRRDEKAAERIAQREEIADRMIGELASGKCYVFPVGGRYREGTRLELVSFLIRNRYA